MNLSVAQLQKALSIRTKIDKLEAAINRLNKQLQEILDGKAVKTKVVRRKRRKITAQRKVKQVKNKGGGLKESLVKVLTQAGKPLHIDDILKGLKAVGHKTASKNIKKHLGVRLYTGKEFLKTAPGTFALKSKTKVNKPVAKPKKTKAGKKKLPF